MNTRTMPGAFHYLPTQDLPAQEKKTAPRKHPLLAALNEARYGSFTIITPEGERLRFQGKEPGAHGQMVLHQWSALDKGLARGEIGFAEGYIDRLWDSPDLPAMITFALMNSEALENYLHGNFWHAAWIKFKDLLHANTRAGSRRNIMAHYDLGNEFYKLWLDDGMTYSSALFEGDANRTLEAAQKAKYRRILRKLGAQPGEHVLDIGCGWGGFAEEAANHGLRVTAITLSEQQAHYARERLRFAGLEHYARVELTDYREVRGRFDHIVSIGMFEHVGEHYWPTYFNTIREHLKGPGKAIIQTITLDNRLFEELRHTIGFIEYYIFPGGMLPSKRRFREQVEKAGLACNEMFSFGQDYARTAEAWLKRFEAHIEDVRELGYDEQFIRLWRFYLSSCIASFASRRTEVMQAEITHLTIH